MSCSDDDLREDDREDDTVVERSVELPATPEEVWSELPALLDDDRVERVAVVEEAVPGRRLSWWWVPAAGDAPPSYVELELEGSAVGTLLRVRETRLDGAALIRSVFGARAFA